MTAEEVEAIRRELGWTRAVMAQRLACDFVSYKRYAANARPVPVHRPQRTAAGVHPR